MHSYALSSYIFTLVALQANSAFAASNRNVNNELEVLHNDTLSSILIRSYIAPTDQAIKKLIEANNIGKAGPKEGDVLILPSISVLTGTKNRATAKATAPTRHTPVPTISHTMTKNNLTHQKTESQIFGSDGMEVLPYTSLRSIRTLSILSDSADSLNSSLHEYHSQVVSSLRRFKVGFLPSKYIDDYFQSSNVITTDLTYTTNSLEVGASNQLNMTSILSGTSETREPTAESYSNIYFLITKPSGSAITINTKFDRYFIDDHELNAIELSYSRPLSGSRHIELSLQHNERTWNILEEYASTTDTNADNYRTNIIGTELYFDSYNGMSLTAESGKNYDTDLNIVSLIAWTHLTDKTYLSLTKTNQPEYFDISFNLQHQWDGRQSAEFQIDLGSSAKSASVFYQSNGSLIQDLDVQLRYKWSVPDKAYNEVAATVSKSF